MDDEAVIAELIQVRGIGRWTAEMFLIFSLLRPDVFPLDDLGLQKGIREAYFRTAGSRCEPWSGSRNLATLALGRDLVPWRSLDPLPVEY